VREPDQNPDDVILIAEDNDDHVSLLLRAFRKASLLNPVFVVRNGEEALDYLQGVGQFANRTAYPLPSLLLLDLRMPVMDGFDVLHWIRGNPDFRALRVVVLTASEDLRDVNRAYHMGVNSFLVKPMDLEDFVNFANAVKGYWLWMSKPPVETASQS
jgi:CheY-like chemotaxis protein